MKAIQRLYLTRDNEALVPEGDPRAALLYCVPGDEIPQTAADRFGLVDGALPVEAAEPTEPAKEAPKPGKTKEAPKPGKTKEAPKPADKAD